MIYYWLLIPACFIWCAILLLPWRPWQTREVLELAPIPDALDDVSVLIPARNEAEVIAATLSALTRQGHGLRIVLIDDGSDDETRVIAESLHIAGMTILNGADMPAGWTGKLWALEQGRHRVDTELVLLLDADIALAPGIISALRLKLRAEGLDLVSLMAELRMVGFWERLLMPAFVYFFKLIYPFELSNSPGSSVAAAAGGCVLLRAAALERIGGFAALRDAVIDDCALAARVKQDGGRIWTGLTHSAHSLRRYADLHDIWNMVARTAFTQLRYSAGLLLACTALMGICFAAPLAGVWLPGANARTLALVTLLLMWWSYLPTLRFYRCSALWGLMLPAIAALYLGMTWSSAVRYWRGERSRWKGRRYQV